MGFKIKKQEGVTNGEYHAKLVDVKEAQGLYGPMLKFIFTLTGGEFNNEEVSMIRPAKLVPGNKLDKTLQDLGIDTSTVSDELDTDVIKGKDVMVKVETKTSDRGKVFANVTAVRLITPADKKGVTPGTGVVGKPAATAAPHVTATPIEEVPF